MELYQLKYFCMIAETQNLSAAALKLNVSQPTLTRVLKNLEDELNTLLFDRNGKKLILNESGKMLASYATHIVEAADEVSVLIQNPKSEISIPLNIVIINDNGFTPDLICAFHKAYPAVHVNMYHFMSIEQVPFSCSLILHSSVELLDQFPLSDLLFYEECMIGMSVGHPLATKDELSAEDLNDAAILTLNQQNSYGGFTREFFSQLGVFPHVEMACSNQFMMDTMVSRGVGVALYPTISWTHDPSKVVLKRIANHRFTQPLYISCTTKLPNYSTELFYAFAKDYCKHMPK